MAIVATIASMSQPIFFLLITVLPFLVLSTTSYAKISIVFSLLRNALGTGQVPSGMLITTLALLLSLHVMAPVATEMADIMAPDMAQVPQALQRYPAGDAKVSSDKDMMRSIGSLFRMFDKSKAPLQQFLFRNAHPRERALFVDLARQTHTHSPSTFREDDLFILMPAFFLSELSEALQVALLLLLPFILVDLLTANTLTALGVQNLDPRTISLPLKLLLFIAVDGWHLLTQALITSYYI